MGLQNRQLRGLEGLRVFRASGLYLLGFGVLGLEGLGFSLSVSVELDKSLNPKSLNCLNPKPLNPKPLNPKPLKPLKPLKPPKSPVNP